MKAEIDGIRQRYMTAYRQACLDGLENTQRCTDLDTLLAEIDRLTAEVERLDKQVGTGSVANHELREALKFYANSEWSDGYPGGIVYHQDGHTVLDMGAIAKAALKVKRVSHD